MRGEGRGGRRERGTLWSRISRGVACACMFYEPFGKFVGDDEGGGSAVHPPAVDISTSVYLKYRFVCYNCVAGNSTELSITPARRLNVGELILCFPRSSVILGM